MYDIVQRTNLTNFNNVENGKMLKSIGDSNKYHSHLYKYICLLKVFIKKTTKKNVYVLKIPLYL